MSHPQGIPAQQDPALDLETAPLESVNGVSYLYDGDCRRVEKVGSKLYWYGSGDEILAETDSSGNTLNEYVYFGGKRIAMLPAGGSPVYYVEDMLGTSRVLTTGTGVVCYDADFYPCGGERAYTNSCPQNYKFEGRVSGFVLANPEFKRERDAESQNDYALARTYVNRLARFSSLDPLSGSPSNPQSLNAYPYVENDPVNLSDPSGLCSPGAICVTAWGDPWFGPAYPLSGGLQDNINAEAQIFAPNLGRGVIDNPPPPINLGPAPQVKEPGARNLAQSILEAENDCSKFLNSAPLVQLGAGNNAITGSNLELGTAAEFLYSDFVEPSPPGYFGSPYTGAGTNEFAGQGAVIVTNSDPRSVWNSAFQPNSTQPYNFPQFAGGTLGAQVVMLLHELGHTVGLLPPDGRGSTAEGFPANQSQLNTQTVLDHCLNAIKAALKGS